MTDADLARLALRFLPGYADGRVRRAFAEATPDSMSAAQAIELFAPDANIENTTVALERAFATAQASQESGVRIISLADEHYPKPLRNIAHLPPFIHVRGTLPEEWSKAVAVVGSREPSPEGVQAAREAVQGLADDRDAIVVSGLALGIDTAAHASALSHGLRTVAVVAHGLQMVFPEANVFLSQEIVSQGGCLLSELPFGEPLTKSHLVARDRLQSGLSIVTAVMQTSLDGGTMHTALFALQQGRKLVALEPLTAGPEWSGNGFLISDSTVHPNEVQRSSFERFARPYAVRIDRTAVTDYFSVQNATSFVPKA